MVLCAMEEEAQPFIADGTWQEVSSFGCARFFASPSQPAFGLALTGIGGVNAAVAATIAIDRYDVTCLIYAGTTGGLGTDVAVRDVICGSDYRYSSADATAFGYAPGQIPHMPEYYPAGTRLATAARALADDSSSTIHIGGVLSADSFITARQAPDMRRTFPTAVGTDMESAFAAQVCHMADVPFMSVRGVSDLCSPDGAKEFHVNTDVAATASATAVRDILARL